MVDEASIKNIINIVPADNPAKLLIEQALAAGGIDNITAILIEKEMLNMNFKATVLPGLLLLFGTTIIDLKKYPQLDYSAYPWILQQLFYCLC